MSRGLRGAPGPLVGRVQPTEQGAEGPEATRSEGVWGRTSRSRETNRGQRIKRDPERGEIGRCEARAAQGACDAGRCPGGSC